MIPHSSSCLFKYHRGIIQARISAQLLEILTVSLTLNGKNYNFFVFLIVSGYIFFKPFNVMQSD